MYERVASRHTNSPGRGKMDSLCRAEKSNLLEFELLLFPSIELCSFG